ncbi:MAG: PilZ domain-containing protein [Thermoanaerobaculia bacterium]
MPERRKFERKKRRLTVEFQWNNHESTGFTYDISPTGMFVRSVRIPGLGMRLKSRLLLPNAKPVHLVGTVVRALRVPTSLARAVPSGFGFRMVEQPPEEYFQFLATL